MVSRNTMRARWVCEFRRAHRAARYTFSRSYEVCSSYDMPTRK
eukprot:COSAG03_NODE_24343_length_273_cov_0.586207_1_plen_42_part_01